MLKVKQLGPNMTLVTREKGNVEILFSYETPVSVLVNSTGEVLKTSTKYSNTTSRHINKWLDGVKPKIVDQSVIDSYCQ